MFDNTRAVILAAGRSTRFGTEKSKLLYSLCGQVMILYPLKLLERLNIPITVVVGYQGEQIKEEIEKANIKNITYVTQKEPLGTGHAVATSQETWDRENVLILNGDLPLLTENIIEALVNEHANKQAEISFLSAHSLNPFGYGRVIKDKDKLAIVEEKNCTQDQRFMTLINAGIYLVSREYLTQNIDKLKLDSVSKEFYLTDLVNLASKQGLKVYTIPVPYDNVRGVNTLEELWAAEQIKRSELMKNWMAKGVRFELAQNIHLDYDVEIGMGSFIGTGVLLLKGTKIGKNCKVNAFTILYNTQVGDNCNIRSHSVIQDSKIGDNAEVGPFARLRDNVELKDNIDIGNFVEIKNSKIDDSSKIKHLTYVGDALVGKGVNIGAGTITCNYDGVNKHQTIIKDNSFIGSNNTLIAPLTIGPNAYTAGGSVINKDVPEGSLAIGRARQENKKYYTERVKKVENEEDTQKKQYDSEQINFMGAAKDKNTQHNL